MGAMHPSEKPYLKTGVVTLAKNRIVWLLVLMISGMVTGGILGRYEAAFAAMPILVTFIPMLTDTGGNAGSQSSTLIIRGIAVGAVSYTHLGSLCPWCGASTTGTKFCPACGRPLDLSLIHI